MRNKILILFILILISAYISCNSNGPDTHKEFIEKRLQAKLPESASDTLHIMVGSFYFHVIGKFDLEINDFIQFMLNNKFTSVPFADIRDYFYVSEYENKFDWWHPGLLKKIISFGKDWEYRNTVNTLVTVDCILIAGSENENEKITVYFNILEHPKY
jgi:hypothetical protein